MSKKAKKSAKDKEPEVIVVKELTPEDLGPEPWIEDLAKYNVNEETWSCHVCLMVERQSVGALVLSQLYEAFDTGTRWPICELSVIRLWPMVRTRCSKSKKISPLSVLCDEIKKAAGMHLDGKIPTEMLASLIKYEILRFKELDLQKKRDSEELEKIRKERYSYYLPKPPQPPPILQTPKKPQSKPSTKKSGKKKSVAVEPEVVVPMRKVDTLLQKRGDPQKYEEWIEDRPKPGPDLYFVVSSVYDPRLPIEMAKLGIPIGCVAELEVQPTTKKTEKALALMLTRTKYRIRQNRRQSLTLCQELKERRPVLDRFWEILASDRLHPEFCKFYNNVIYVRLTPPLELIDSHSLEASLESFRKSLYDKVANMVYESYMSSLLYRQYLEEMRLIPVTVTSPPTEMELYTYLMDAVPCQAATVPFILDSMLVQVCHWLHDEPGYRLEDYKLEEEVKKKVRHSWEDLSVLKNRIDHLRNLYDLPVDRPDPPLLPRPAPERKKMKVLMESEEIDLVCFNETKGVAKLYKDRLLRILIQFWECQPWRKKFQLIAAMDQRSNCPRPNEDATPHDPTKFVSLVTGFGHMRQHSNVKKNSTATVSDKLNFCEELSTSATLLALYNALLNNDNWSYDISKDADGSLLKFYDATSSSRRKVSLPSVVHLVDFFSETMNRETEWVEWKRKIRRAEEDEAAAAALVPDFENAIEYLNYPIVEPVPAGQTVFLTWRDLASVQDGKVGDDVDVVFKRCATLFAQRERLRREAEEAERARKGPPILLRPVYDMGETRKCSISLCLENYSVGLESKITVSSCRRTEEYTLLNLGCYLGQHSLRFAAPVARKTSGSLLTLVHGSGLRIAMEETQWPHSPYLDFKISWPSGLVIETANDSNGSLYFRQKYILGPPKNSGLSPELHRCILDDGTVLKFTDGELTEILQTNGTIIEYESIDKTGEEGAIYGGEGEEEEPQFHYDIITPDGRVISSVGRWCFPTGNIEIRESQDLANDSIRTERADGSWLVHYGGDESTMIVDYPDGTRMTSRSRFSEEEIFCEWEDWELEWLDRIGAWPEPEWENDEWPQTNSIQEETSQNEIKKDKEAHEDFVLRNMELVRQRWKEQEGKSLTEEVKATEISTYVPRNNFELRSMEFAQWKENQRKEELEAANKGQEPETSTLEQELNETPEFSSDQFTEAVPKIQWEFEGYLTIETSVTVEHAYYATVHFNYDRSGIELGLPFGVSLEMGPSGVERVNLNDEANLTLGGGKAHFVREPSSRLPSHRFMVDFNAYTRAQPRDLMNELLLRSVSHDGKVVEVDTSGVAVTRDDRSASRVTQDAFARYFFVRQDYSSTEFSPEHRAIKYFTNKEKMKGTVLQKYDEEEFSEYLIMEPFGGADKKWTVPRSEFKTKEGLPSTFGESWQFPLTREREGVDLAVPEALVTRHLSQLRDANLDPSFKGRLSGDMPLYKFLDNLADYPDKAEDMYLKGSLYTKSPDTELLEYFETNVVEHAYKLATKEKRKTNLEETFKFQRSALVEGLVPPYFETSEGVAFLMKIEIEQSVMIGIKKLNDAEDLCNLLMVPFAEMTEEAMDRTCRILEESAMRLGLKKRTRREWRRVMDAGRFLSQMFPNMKLVLEFQKKCTCGNDD